ncbi:hypothetical protein [Cytobacillus firmus]|uniref:hypothetical protein n=1 Tax=Cytobacillus firmus TaxID=1399 RepID=UPI001C8DD5B2|nr:hypothetical protein [Cytobacillus firmus]MBX9976363.1 hypothetical protein [Cytobacillus firmus]
MSNLNIRIIGFFPLDVIGDPEATKENYAKLKTMVPGANLIPVFQVSDSLKSLEMLVDEEHEVIALGGLIPLMKKGLNHCRATLDRIFNIYSNVNFHFLGGANELLLEYPFFQVIVPPILIAEGILRSENYICRTAKG